MPAGGMAGCKLARGQTTTTTTTTGAASLLAWASLWILSLSWLVEVAAMRPGRIAELRQDTVDMFYHGFDNYMQVAFPEDEVGRTKLHLS
jgi:hypothetical protein